VPASDTRRVSLRRGRTPVPRVSAPLIVASNPLLEPVELADDLPG
jgi:hypothetical protein